MQILCDQCKRPMAVPNDINLEELKNENGDILCPECEGDREDEEIIDHINEKDEDEE